MILKIRSGLLEFLHVSEQDTRGDDSKFSWTFLQLLVVNTSETGA